MPDRGHPVFARFYDRLGPRLDARGTAEHRRRLLARAAGRVVEVGAGCHPNRDTLGAIRAAGFEVREVDRFDEPGEWLAKPHVLGWAEPR